MNEKEMTKLERWKNWSVAEFEEVKPVRSAKLANWADYGDAFVELCGKLEAIAQDFRRDRDEEWRRAPSANFSWGLVKAELEEKLERAVSERWPALLDGARSELIKAVVRLKSAVEDVERSNAIRKYLLAGAEQLIKMDLLLKGVEPTLDAVDARVPENALALLRAFGLYPDPQGTKTELIAKGHLHPAFERAFRTLAPEEWAELTRLRERFARIKRLRPRDLVVAFLG